VLKHEVSVYSKGMSETTTGTKKTNHLVKTAVIIISATSLAVALLNYRGLDSINSIYTTEYKNCVNLMGNTPKAMTACSESLKAVKEQSNRIYYGVMIGLGLPVIYFGSKFILNSVEAKKARE